MIYLGSCDLTGGEMMMRKIESGSGTVAVRGIPGTDVRELALSIYGSVRPGRTCHAEGLQCQS